MYLWYITYTEREREAARLDHRNAEQGHELKAVLQFEHSIFLPLKYVCLRSISILIEHLPNESILQYVIFFSYML